MSIHGTDDLDQKIDNERLLCVLTSRQMEVIRLRIQGLTLQEIGQDLGVSHQAVCVVIGSARRRLSNHIAKSAP